MLVLTPMNERQFKEFNLNERMDIINLNGTYVGNRSYYNHSINLYTVYGYFPIQNLLKMLSNKSSVVISPVIKPN